jgi:hypothetical protein
MMTRSLAFSLLCCATVFAGETLREIRLEDLSKHAGMTAAKEAAGEGARVSAPAGQAATVRLALIENPGVTAAMYAVVGRLRHEGVGGTGYLETWNSFPEGKRYFSRTLANQGPMKSLSGTAGWRRFVVPFYLKDSPARPEKIELNLVLPQGGTVWFNAVRLVQFAPGEDPMSGPGDWWGAAAGGWAGAIVGVIGGLLGALVGILASAGAARALVLGLTRAGVSLGILFLAAGVAAVASGQPYAVWYPLLLGGAVLAAVFTAITPGLRLRYQALEMRRMESLDAGGQPRNGVQ